jgi:hypothetical protein
MIWVDRGKGDPTQRIHDSPEIGIEMCEDSIETGRDTGRIERPATTPETVADARSVCPSDDQKAARKRSKKLS